MAKSFGSQISIRDTAHRKVKTQEHYVVKSVSELNFLFSLFTNISTNKVFLTKALKKTLRSDIWLTHD